MSSDDGVRDNSTNIKTSPSGSCVSKSSCKENINHNAGKEYIDEDGFKPRIALNDKLPDRNKRSEKRVLEVKCISYHVQANKDSKLQGKRPPDNTGIPPS